MKVGDKVGDAACTEVTQTEEALAGVHEAVTMLLKHLRPLQVFKECADDQSIRPAPSETEACEAEDKQKCLDEAPAWAAQDKKCLGAMLNGVGICSKKHAQAIFRRAVDKRCGPICDICEKI